MAAQDLAKMVDPMTGQARYSLPLISYPGRGGLDLAVGASYGSGTLGAATRWNLDAPTGVMGLGWTLGGDSIRMISDGASTLPGDRTYILSVAGVTSPLVCTGQSGDGSSTWAAVYYVFWKITYDPAQELWTVVDTDGITRLFGGAGADNGAVDWGVAWNDWSAINGSDVADAPLAVGWSLSAIVNLFGDRIGYAYDQIEVAVLPTSPSSPTTLSFTRETVLSQITGVDGSRIVLSYAPKDPDEYQDPCTSPAPPNGGQDVYPTQYLSELALYSASGALLETVQLVYAATPLGTDDMTKRLLASVTYLTGQGVAKAPPTSFTYWGQDAADGVTAQNIYAAPALYGALATVTLPTGGVLSFDYQAVPLSYADRSLPANAGSGWTEPAVYTFDDKILMTWLSGTDVILQAFVWCGRWLAATVMTVPLAGVAYSDVQVASGPGTCALLAGSTLVAAHRDPSIPGGWLAAQSFSLTLAAGESAALVAGRGFAATLGLQSGTLFTCRFTGADAGTAAFAGGWTADTATGIGTSGDQFALAAEGGLFAALAVPAGGGAASVLLYQHVPAGGWQTAAASLDLGLVGSGVSLSMGAGFATAMATVAAPGGQTATYAGFWWSDDAMQLFAQAWPSVFATSGSVPPVPSIAGATVAIAPLLYRFTGSGWTMFNTNSIACAGATGTPDMSIGSDLAVRVFDATGGGTVSDLLAYDPLAGTWAVPTQNDGSAMAFSASTAEAAAPTTAGGLSNYVVIGGALWYRSADQTWSNVLDLPAGLNASDAATIRLMGNRYLALQSGTGTASLSTLVYQLSNGTVVSDTPDTLTGAQIALPADAAGCLVSPYGFAAYTGTWGSAAAAITLYQPVSGAVTGTQTGYAALSVTATNGYQNEAGINGSFTTSFTYAAGTIDPSGYIPYFNTVTVAPGAASANSPVCGTQVVAFYNGLATGETPATAYPAGAAASGQPLAALGAIYQDTANKSLSGGTLAAIRQSVLVQDVTELPLGDAGIGCYSRTLTTTANVDGVSSTVSMTYDSQTGFTDTVSTEVVQGDGSVETWTTTYTYFWSQYDPSRDLNLLSPVIQTVVERTPVATGSSPVTSIGVETWRLWGPGQTEWAPDRRYRGLQATATFSAWNPDQTPPAADFLLVGQILSRTPAGLPTEMSDSMGTLTSVHFDLSGTYPVAEAKNAAYTDFQWYGCEPYETSGGWTSTTPGLTIDDYITTADYHTGTQCLALPADNDSTGPMLAVVPGDQAGNYVFSCWAKIPPGYDTASGIAMWTIAPYDPATGDAAGDAIELALSPATSGVWTYFQVTLNMTDIVDASGGLATVGLSFLATNANPSAVCYLDELRFAPLDCAFGATVHNPASFQVTATVNTNGQPAIAVYDQFDRPSVLVGPQGRVTGVVQTGFALWSSGQNGGFNTALPNATLTAASPIGSCFLDFHEENSSDWTFTGSTWSLSGGQLSFAGTDTSAIGATAQYDPLTDANLAATVTVATTPADGTTVSLGNGAYYMCWTADASLATGGSWTLVELTTTSNSDGSSSVSSTTLATNDAVAYQANWLFAIIDGMIVCYAGAAPLFYQQTSSTGSTAGYITLAATASVAFDNLSVLEDPMLSWAAEDGLGQQFLSLSLLGYEPSGSNGLYPGDWVISAAPTLLDTLGRPQYIGQAMQAPAASYAVTGPAPNSYALLDMNQPTYLVSADGSSQSVGNYEDGTYGYTYDQPTYEASPLSRVIMQDGPRGAYVAGTSYCTELITYGGSATVGSAPGADSGTLTYSVVSHQALQQNQATASTAATAVTLLGQTTRDTLGRVLMEQSGPAAGPWIATGYSYNSAGLLSGVYLPNYYVPPAGSAATDWVVTYDYDFLGQRICQTAPDSGTTEWAYDNMGRVRFKMDANGAAQTPQQILYTTYDALGRVVATGYIQDSDYTWNSNSLTAQLNNMAFPAIGAAASDPNAAQGAVSSQTCYDTDNAFTNGASFSLYLIGQAVSVTLPQSDQPTAPDGTPYTDIETYSYDAFGNVLSKTVEMNNISPAGGWTIAYTYDACNRVISVTQPDMTATATSAGTGAPVTVGYGYDRLGRLAAVGGAPTQAVIDPDNPPLDQDQTYAAYVYDTYGYQAQALYNNAGGAAGPQIARTFSYDPSQRLTGIGDDYMDQVLTYATGSDVNGWTYFNQMLISIESEYGCDGGWSDALCCNSQTFSYDGYGRIVSGTSSLGNAFGLTVTAYNNNGNMQSASRGISASSYSYLDAGGALTDRVQSVTVTAAASLSFASTASASAETVAAAPTEMPWSWGSSNGGLSTSDTTITTPVGDGTEALMLAGGSVGHYEVLELDTFAASGTAYTLSWSAATGSGYPADGTADAETGGAAWYAILNAADGPVCALRLATVANSPTAWTSGSCSLDLTQSGIEQLVGAPVELVSVSIELRNLCCGNDGSAGAAVYIASADFAMAGSGSVVAPYSYDANGNVTSATARDLTLLTYDAVSGLTSSVEISGEAGIDTLSFAYGANARRSRATLNQARGAPTQQTVTLTGVAGEILATQVTSGGTVTGVSTYINGSDGPLAVIDTAGSTAYLLTDRLGTPQVTVRPADSADPVASAFTATPFGNPEQATGQPATQLGYTGQWLDAPTGLYNYNARLYDPTLGRFYATDPVASPTSPYVYCGNDPVNFTDPSGNFFVGLSTFYTGAYTLYSYWGEFTGNQLALMAGVSILGAHLGAVLTVGFGGNYMYRSTKPYGNLDMRLRLLAGFGSAYLGGWVSGGVPSAMRGGIREYNREGSTTASIASVAASDFLSGGFASANWGLLSYTGGLFLDHTNAVFYENNLIPTRAEFNAAQQYYINTMPPQAFDWIRQKGVAGYWNAVKNSMRLGGLHEWLEVGQVATTRSWGMSYDQIVRYTTSTAVNPMFTYQGNNFAHVYNDAHRFNTYMLATSPGVFVYRIRLWYSGLMPAGAQPAANMFNVWDWLTFPYR